MITQAAYFGKYGTFELYTSPDDSKMNWYLYLENINELSTELGLDFKISSLNYHLHQQWTWEGNTWAYGENSCGSFYTGGHYDPYFACGPASGVSDQTCQDIGKGKDQYSCTGAYDDAMYDKCEVGDLSGKYGQIFIDGDGKGDKWVQDDPLPALDYHFVPGTTNNPPDRFSSIVLHLGAQRVLCGQLRQVETWP
jgi:hypothetical protein